MNCEKEYCNVTSSTDEWPSKSKQITEKSSDSDENNTLEADESPKIKPEVELKEETEGFVYKTDFRGHLQLVSLSADIPNSCHVNENQINNDEATKSSIDHSSSLEATYNNCNYQQFLLQNKKSINDEVIEKNCGRHDKSFQVSSNNNFHESDNHGHWQNMACILPTSDTSSQVIVTFEEDHSAGGTHIYRQLKNVSDGSVQESYYVKKEPTENFQQHCNFVQTLPEIYDYPSAPLWEQANSSSQSQDASLKPRVHCNNRMLLLTQAEKKRLYRMRIKEENPALWTSIKKREAARKREQREKRRQVLYEMQKAMEYESSIDSPEAENNRLYLEALKERYPELWNQLNAAIPATQLRNEIKYDERSPRSRMHVPKPARMYKDVIEAQKKRIYRQRMKEERPELYAKQKARDAYARSLQRMMLKGQKNARGIQNKSEEILNSEEAQKELSYLHNFHLDSLQSMDPKKAGEQFANLVAMNPGITGIPISDALKPRSNANPKICDNQCPVDNYNTSKGNLISSDNNISTSNKTKDQRSLHMGPSSTQSDVLWYWNDVKSAQLAYNNSFSPIINSGGKKSPKVLSEEERLQKITREQMQLREKRRLYRMSMTSEQRSEYLENERERLKIYHLKKRAEIAMEREVLCANQ